MKGVIANSFPKSGTHVLTRLLTLLGYAEANSHLSRSLVLFGPKNFLRNWQIALRLSRDSKGIPVDIECPQRRIKNEWLSHHIKQYLKQKKYVQGHLPYSREMDALISEIEIPVLYIHRDPRDVLVSLKNYILRLKNHPNHELLKKIKTDRERFEVLLSGYQAGSNINTMSPFFTKYAHSIAWTKSNNVCDIQYEKAIGPKGGGNIEDQIIEIRKVTDYLNHHEIDIEEIVKSIFDTGSETFHKGTIGQWEEEFDDSTMELYDRHFRAFLILNAR